MRAASASLALVTLAAACVRTAAPVVPPPALPASAPVSVPDDLPPLTVCVVRDGVLAHVRVLYNPATGDSLYEGRRFSDAFPIDSSFGAGARWFDEQQVVLDRRPYVKYGRPRALRPDDVVAHGEFRGMKIFMEPEAWKTPGPIVYLPVRPTCEFQPYKTGLYGPAREGLPPTRPR